MPYGKFRYEYPSWLTIRGTLLLDWQKKKLNARSLDKGENLRADLFVLWTNNSQFNIYVLLQVAGTANGHEISTNWCFS